MIMLHLRQIPVATFNCRGRPLEGPGMLSRPRFPTRGIGLTRDSWVSVMYAEELNSAKSSDTLQGYALKAGHPLEGSCQEGKHPPYTPFCIFCRGMSHGISLPICRFARTRVFSDCDVTRSMATHQTPIRIKAHDGHLALWPGIRPLAHLVPQKTLGTLPCPIVTSTVHVALP